MPETDKAFICTSARCTEFAAHLVSWSANPDGLPFCRRCAAKLAEHGDRVQPLVGDAAAAASRPSALAS